MSYTAHNYRSLEGHATTIGEQMQGMVSREYPAGVPDPHNDTWTGLYIESCRARRALAGAGYTKIVAGAVEHDSEVFRVIAETDDGRQVTGDYWCHRPHRMTIIRRINEWVDPDIAPLSTFSLREWIHDAYELTVRATIGETLEETDRTAYENLILDRIDMIRLDADGTIETSRALSRIGVSIDLPQGTIRANVDVIPYGKLSREEMIQSISGMIRSIGTAARKRHAEQVEQVEQVEQESKEG